jgi:hypothetical protein
MVPPCCGACLETRKNDSQCRVCYVTSSSRWSVRSHWSHRRGSINIVPRRHRAIGRIGVPRVSYVHTEGARIIRSREPRCRTDGTCRYGTYGGIRNLGITVCTWRTPSNRRPTTTDDRRPVLCAFIVQVQIVLHFLFAEKIMFGGCLSLTLSLSPSNPY